MKKEYFTKTPQETREIGKKLAEKILRKPLSLKAQVIGLRGDLGAGKTTFLQGFAAGLSIEEKILSPTFVIMKKFKIKNSNFKKLVHIDCYRIEGSSQIKELGFEEIISDPQNIVVIEWAERVEDILPEETIFIDFRFMNKEKRKILLGF